MFAYFVGKALVYVFSYWSSLYKASRFHFAAAANSLATSLCSQNIFSYLPWKQKSCLLLVKILLVYFWKLSNLPEAVVQFQLNFGLWRFSVEKTANSQYGVWKPFCSPLGKHVSKLSIHEIVSIQILAIINIATYVQQWLSFENLSYQKLCLTL